MSTKNQRGRPPTADRSAIQSAIIPGFRSTEAQDKAYRKAAKKDGKSLSAWLRSIADQHS